LLNSNRRLGDDTDEPFTENSIQLHEGDTLFFYTDGLIENENPEKMMWGERNLNRFLREHYQLPIQELLDQLVEEAYAFYDDYPAEDDITLVGCKITRPFPTPSSK